MNEDEDKNQRKKRDPEANAESTEWNTWIVASGSELKAAFGLTAENRPSIKLNPERVPNELIALIPYAEEWGIEDDLIRADVLRKASPTALKMLIIAVNRHIDLLSDWLADPEADLDEHTEEYHTFSALLMAYEEARTDTD